MSAMDAVLQQHVKNTWQPLTFPKKFNPAQQKYSTYDRKPLAIYEAVKQVRHMLEICHFILIDHKRITYAFQKKRDKCSPGNLIISPLYPNLRLTYDTSLDRTTLSPMLSLALCPSMRHHLTTHWT
jgi:hypothetical protein